MQCKDCPAFEGFEWSPQGYCKGVCLFSKMITKSYAECELSLERMRDTAEKMMKAVQLRERGK